MKGFLTVMIVATVGFACACSSGGSGGGPVQSGLTASFIPDQSPPGTKVAAGQKSNSNSTVTIEITVTDTDPVYAASFDLVYDSTQATYLGWDAGTLLEQGGQTVNYNVTESAGELVVSASREGPVPGADATGTRTVIELTFQVDVVGSSAISYQAETLLDGQQQPQPIPVNWYSGTLTGI